MLALQDERAGQNAQEVARIIKEEEYVYVLAKRPARRCVDSIKICELEELAQKITCAAGKDHA